MVVLKEEKTPKFNGSSLRSNGGHCLKVTKRKWGCGDEEVKLGRILRHNKQKGTGIGAQSPAGCESTGGQFLKSQIQSGPGS